MSSSQVQFKQRIIFSRPRRAFKLPPGSPVEYSFAVPLLPVDVLQEIFASLFDQCPTVSQKREALFAISHVCSIWRQAVLTYRRLWAQIVSPNDPCFARSEEIFSRAAKDAPFSINARIQLPSELPTQPQWEKVLKGMDRASIIDILFEGERTVGDRDLDEILKRQAPSLKELVISCQCNPAQVVAFQSPSKTPLLMPRAASLRVLELRNCTIVPSAALLFPNLIDFTITIVAQCPSFDSNIDLLLPWWDMCFGGRMPSLQNLTINGAFAGDVEELQRIWPIRTQPKSLKMIHLSGELETIAAILGPDRFALPPCCDLRLHIQYPYAWSGNVEFLDSVLSHILRNDASPCLEFTLDDHPFTFKHTSAVRTIWISGGSARDGSLAVSACRQLMLRLVNEHVVTKLNLTLQTAINAMEVVHRPRRNQRSGYANYLQGL